ncbi:unnamed protein product [Brassica napus]|uniref:(rape) hypothetical protein n=1 Tax=Brassica napus TaxID=3708 RepID=A0A816PBQ7_BRANA|nr:unnamed protein product [Brassica napus]
MSCLCHCLVRFCLPSVIFLTVNLRNLRSRYSLNVQQGAGDPLYVAEGQPKCFDPDIVDATPTEDGCSWEPWISSIHLHAYQVVELPSLLNTRKVLKAVAPLPPILQKKVRAKTISSCKFSWISLPPDNITCDSLKVILLGKHT